MKILNFNLQAYGPFTDKCLDLSGGNEGLHLIYGPNEAGKSAALRAMKALLYGIPSNTTDNFHHENPKLRVGGRLRHSDRSELNFFRRKGQKNTVVDADDKALNESLLLKFLDGVSEEMFTAFFGIDHRELVDGGQQLVAGGGSLGESLFAAGMGLSQLHQVLQALESEAEGLFKSGGRNPKINALLSTYRDTQRAVNEQSLSGQDWVKHEEALNSAQVDLKQVTQRLNGLRTEMNRLERLMKAIPLVSRRKELEAQLVAMGVPKILRQGFAQERHDVLKDLNDAKTRQERVSRELQEIGEKIAAISVPASLVQQADAVIDLFQTRGAFVKAQKDLPALQRDHHRLLSEAEVIFKELRPELPFAQVESVRMTAQKTARIQELGLRMQYLLDELPRSQKAMDDVRGELDEAKLELAEIPTINDPTELRRAIAATGAEGNVEKTLRSAMDSLRLQQEEAQIGLKGLGLWTGTQSDLESCAAPLKETIDRFEEQFTAFDLVLRQINDRNDSVMSEANRVNQEIDALRNTGQIPTEADLIAAREQREKGWRLVRKAWLEHHEDAEVLKAYSPDWPLDKTYEYSVRDSDQVADRMRHEAHIVAKHGTLLADRERFGAQVSELEAKRLTAEKSTEHLKEQWVALWQPLGILPSSPKEMRAWLQRRDHLLEQAKQIRETQAIVGGLRSQTDELADRLGECMEQAREQGRKLGESLQNLLGRSKEIVSRFEESARQRKEVAKNVNRLERALNRSTEAHRQTQDDIGRWKTDWASAVNEIGLTAGAMPAEANAVLSRIHDLFQSIAEAEGFRQRIEDIGRESRQFSADVNQFCENVAPDLLQVPVDQAVVELHQRSVQAQTNSATLTQLVEQQKKHNDTFEAAKEIIVQAEGRLAEMCRHAGCEKAEELTQLEQQSEAALDLGTELKQVDESLAMYSAGGTVAELLQEAEAVAADMLTGQLDELVSEIRDMEVKHAMLNQTVGAERTELQKMDGSAKAAETSEEAHAILAQIRTHSERYVRVHLASAILRREIARYQEANQGPILQQTGKHFADLTIGSFASVSTSFDTADKPILLGVRPSGEKVGVEGMSDGTRDQLYLALRLASLQKHLATMEPMPFIIDDILVNFDDDRAVATLKVLGEFSSKTQVVFFTHHAHLVELAKKVVPANVLQVHQLGTA